MEQECSEFSEFTESNKSLKQFIDYVSHMCFAGIAVASWLLTEEVSGLSPLTAMRNIFVTEFAAFSENI